jgi:hypothetical protein
MRHIVRRVAFLLLGVAAATACGDAVSMDDIHGVWHTASIDGDSVPGTVEVDGRNLYIQHYRWTFAEGSCAVLARIDGNEVSADCELSLDPEQGTVSIVNGTYTAEGPVEGDQMSLTGPDSVTWVLQKQ